MKRVEGMGGKLSDGMGGKLSDGTAAVSAKTPVLR
jgi:hypothetical protein